MAVEVHIVQRVVCMDIQDDVESGTLEAVEVPAETRVVERMYMTAMMDLAIYKSI